MYKYCIKIFKRLIGGSYDEEIMECYIPDNFEPFTTLKEERFAPTYATRAKAYLLHTEKKTVGE